MASPYTDPDMHYKICKKMAQLTRVIYQMNIRNDENEQLIKARIDAYEQELANVVKDCNKAISKYKADIENLNSSNDVQNKVNQLRDKIKAEQDKSKKEYLGLKKKIEEREQRIGASSEVSHSLLIACRIRSISSVRNMINLQENTIISKRRSRLLRKWLLS